MNVSRGGERPCRLALKDSWKATAVSRSATCRVNRPGNNIADPDADPDGWVRALDRMLELDLATPGHGVQGAKGAIRGQRAYLSDMIQQVRAGIGRGATAAQLEKQINLKTHNPWGQDDARNTVSIRAVYAELQRAR